MSITLRNKFYILILFVSILAVESCKVNYSTTGASIPVEAKTVSVAYFQNNASLAPPTLSAAVTEALKDFIIQRSRLGLVNQGADLTFEGTITNYSVQPIAIQSTDQASMNRLTITVSVKYENKFEEKKNFESSFSRFADFSSSQSLSSVETQLITEINNQLTQDIFNKAFNNW